MLDRLIDAALDTRDLIEVVLDNTGHRTVVFTVFGALIGSFLTVVVSRLPVILKERSLIDAAEFFPHLVADQQVHENCTDTHLGGFSITPCCSKPIKFIHNIPLISWVLLKGKCAYCGSNISSKYLTIEIFTAVLFGVSAFLSSNAETAFILSGVGAVLIAVAVIDHNEMLIPDELNLFLAVIAMLAVHLSVIDTSIGAAFSSAVGTFLCLSLLNAVTYRKAGVYAIGGGDIKLMAAISMFIGTATSLILTAIALIAVVIVTKASSGKKGTYTALGPYLAVLSWLTVVTMQ